MSKYQLREVSRIYKVDKDVSFYALKKIFLTLQGPGFISIVGKSGSGKSTILNLLCGLDKASEGEIYYGSRNISNFSKKERNTYFKKEIGILFQNYNLIETESALFNVSLPLSINGENKKVTKTKAIEALKAVGLDENTYAKHTSLLSGGEKQRVGLARTLINEPDVLFCDEPTGHLDTHNSIKVMEILKKYSEKHLVILVSHNLQLVKSYSDRIIEIENGRIKSDSLMSKGDKKGLAKSKKPNPRSKTSDRWINRLTLSDFKRCFKRNIFSFLALSLSLVFAFLSFGFMNGKEDSIKESSLKQLDFGVGTISKEEKISESTLLSLSRSTRPNFKELINTKEIMQNFHICPNFDAILPSSIELNCDAKKVEGCFFSPIYAFNPNYVNTSLISKGKISSNNLESVVINKKAYQLIEESIKKEPLGQYIEINHHDSFTYVDFDETRIIDDFYFIKKLKIIAVVDELDYLSTPKIYYSYSAFEEYICNQILPNLSTYFDYDISWYDRIYEADNVNPIASYSYRLFPKTIDVNDAIYEGLDYGNFNFTSPSLLIKDSLLNFMQVAEYGLILFLVIALIGSVLILGIMSFTSYSENHHLSAILTCLGAKTSEISDIYLNQNVLVTLFSLVFAFIISFLLQGVANPVIYKYAGLKNLIVIPLASYLGMPYLFPILGLLTALLISMLVTVFPILFSKKIELKEELQSE